MELIGRSKNFETKAELDRSDIKEKKSIIRTLEKEKKKLQSSNDALVAEKSLLQEEKKQLEIQAKSSLAEAEESKTRAEQLDQLLARKDEDLLAKIGSLAKAENDLSFSRAEQERTGLELMKIRAEHAARMREIEELKVQLHGKTSALETKEAALQAAELRAKEEAESTVEDCVNQMRDARNEYFLEGWEAAMLKNNIHSSNPIYTAVPYPDPSRPAPPFSFQRQPETPSLLTQGEEGAEEGEAEVESAKKDTHPQEDKEITLIVESGLSKEGEK